MPLRHPSDHEAAPAPRPSHHARRWAAVLAGLVLVATVPLVARALETEVTPDDRVITADPPAPATAREPAESAGPPVTFDAVPPVPPVPTLPELHDRPIPRDPMPSATVATAEAAPDEVPTESTGESTSDAAADPTSVLTDGYAWDERSPRVAELQRVLGVSADGWYAAATRRAHLDALVEAGLPADGVPDVPGPAAAEWEALRQCESGGDYSIVSRSGRYRGAYQFDRTTWDSVAGRHAPGLVGVDPADAAPADQDAMALALYGERGAQPWPHCGRHLR